MGLHRRLPITSTNVTLTLPNGLYYTTPPIVQVTIEGAPTNVDIIRNMTTLGNFGDVYTSITFIFNTADIGKYCNISVYAE